MALYPYNAPDIEGGGQGEHQTGKQDGGRGELKLAMFAVWAKRPAPYRIAAAGFQTLAPEPCLHLSAHTALHLLTQFSSVQQCMTIPTERQGLAVSRNHKALPIGLAP